MHARYQCSFDVNEKCLCEIYSIENNINYYELTTVPMLANIVDIDIVWGSLHELLKDYC